MSDVRLVVPHPRGWDVCDNTELNARMLASAKAEGVPWVGSFVLGLCRCTISLDAGPTWIISMSVATHRPSDSACEALRRCCQISSWEEIEVEGTKHARYFQIPAVPYAPS